VCFAVLGVEVVTAGKDTEGVGLGLFQKVADWRWGLILRALAAAPRSAGTIAVAGMY